MKAAIHYVVKVKLIRYETKDEINFIDFEKSFENENPIKAREEAFKEYEEWINDLYTGIGRPSGYVSDRQARIDLKRLTTPSEKHNVQVDENMMNFDDSFGYGIAVYLVVDKPYEEDQQEGDEYLLHGIGTSYKYNDALEISDALNNEILYYEHYEYDKGNYERRTNFYDWFLGDTEEISFLETPFDWTGLDVKSGDEMAELEFKNFAAEFEKYENDKNPNTIEKIVENGEGNQVEFKPALLYNFKTGKAGIGVKGKIATAICAFLNANGGLLFIGLNDDGAPQGLEYDFSLAAGKKPKDFFQNEFDQMIEHFLTFAVKSNITGQFYELGGKDIFIISVEPSKNRAIFVKGQNGKEFWIRGNAGNRQLTDIEELANYCIDRWNK